MLDIDGFILPGRRYPREIGFAPIRPLTKTYRVSVNLFKAVPKSRWSTKDQKTINYCFHRLHGLPDQLTYEELQLTPFINVSEVGDQIEEWYAESRDEMRNVVAYKGGSWERKLLEELDIPSANLEDFGCPKLERITSKNYLCPFHKKSGPQIHCAGFEVRVFRDWLLDNMTTRDS